MPPMNTPESIIAALTTEEKDLILHDLLICLATGRLLDSSTGWERKSKTSVRPQHSGPLRPGTHAPSWQSLDAFKQTFPTLKLTENKWY